MERSFGDLRLVDDIGAGRWIVDALHPFAEDVGSLVPSCFEAYARVFHPAHRQPVRWKRIAEANARVFHPVVQFTKIALIPGPYPGNRSQPGLWDSPPRIGSLTVEEATTLAAALRPHTATPEDCFFAYWRGRQALRIPADAPTLKVPQREMFVLKGPIEAVAERLLGVGQLHSFAHDAHHQGDDHSDRCVSPPSGVDAPLYQSPSLWWPRDRAWCVATEVDLVSTFAGGSREGIDAILNSPLLESLPIGIASRIARSSDDLNPEAQP
jgi:hypothetical protein